MTIVKSMFYYFVCYLKLFDILILHKPCVLYMYVHVSSSNEYDVLTVHGFVLIVLLLRLC